MSSQLGEKTQAPTCRGSSAEAPGHKDSCVTQQARPPRPPQVHGLERCSGWKRDVPGAEMEAHTVSLRSRVYRLLRCPKDELGASEAGSKLPGALATPL